MMTVGTVGRFVVSVLRSSLPAVLSMSVIQSNKPTSRHVNNIEMYIPGHHIRVSCVYFGFLFPFGLFFWFLGKLTTGRPWPTPWPTPGFVPGFFAVVVVTLLMPDERFITNPRLLINTRLFATVLERLMLFPIKTP